MSEEREDGEHNSLVEHVGRLPVVELREPRNLCVCVNKARGHGKGAGANVSW